MPEASKALSRFGGSLSSFLACFPRPPLYDIITLLSLSSERPRKEKFIFRAVDTLPE
jgi:hypothetical protein